MRTRSLLVLAGALVTSTLFAAGSVRFSQALTAEQRTECGLGQLNSDQVAALDALVRLSHHQAAADAQKRAAEPAAVAAPAAFSQSLSADQRRAAGLDLLSAEQQTAVDALVVAHGGPGVRYDPAAPKPVQAVQFFPDRFEVHGEVGFSLGVGSGGYNSRAGWVTTSLLDTKTGTEFSVSVATGREKWNGPYRYGYYDDWRSIGLGLTVPLRRP